MKKTKNILFQLWSILLLLILGTLPIAFSNIRGKVDFQLMRIPEEITHFIQGLFDGSSFYYLEGSRVKFFFHDIGRFFVPSYVYLLTAGVLIIILSIIFGIWLWKRSERGLNTFVGFIGMIPDFILVFLLQLFVFFIYKTTGVKTVKVASSTMDDPAIALPLITLFILPFVYLIGSLSEKTFDVLTEDYIRTALSKGLSKSRIYLSHVTTNVFPYLKADLHKVVSIMIGNLFIIEYLYNIKGLTYMIFPMRMEYQYNLVTLTFISFFILYISVYLSMKAIVILIERIFTHEGSI